MAKVLFIGDPHHKYSNFDLGKSFLTWVNGFIRDNFDNIDVVVNLGDHFDTHGVVRSEVMTEYIKHVSYITETCEIPYLHLLGNHEMHKNGSYDYHVLQTMEHLQFDRYYAISDSTHLFGMYFVPYVHDIDDFPLDIKGTSGVVVAHQTFIGADYGYYRPGAGVDADKSVADIIISGHVHKRQMFGKVIYPGTPFAQSANDINEVKGVMLFDTDTYEFNFVDCPMPQWKGLKINYSENTLSNISSLVPDCSKDHWVIEITGLKSEITAFLSATAKKAFIKGKDIQFRVIHTDKKKAKIKIDS